MTFKNSKFAIAGLLAITLVGFISTHDVSAQTQSAWTKENYDKYFVTEQQKTLTSQKAITPLAGGNFWTSSPACTHTATGSNWCSGYNNTPFAGLFYYETPPRTFNPLHVPCGFSYPDCVNTADIIQSPVTISYGGVTYTFSSAQSVQCATNLNVCSTPVFWNSYVYSKNIPVQGAPANTPIQTQTQFLYKSGSDTLAIGFANYLQYGYN